MSKTLHFMPSRAGLSFAGVLFLLQSCSPPANVEVSHVRQVEQTDPARPGATHADRFGSQAPGDSGGMGGMGEVDARSISEVLREQLEWDVPEGWQELAAGGMRIASLRPAGDPDADCSLIILEGSGGGLEGNVNRWRGQMGLAPLSPAEIAVLPTRDLVGQAGVLVDLDGTYTGMGGPERPDWNMLGVILAGDEFTMFLKMTAPEEVAQAEREAFEAFCSSIRLVGEPAGAAPPAGPLSYAVPDGWSDQGPKSMRAVNLMVGESQCYVILLGGEAGGLQMNLNRWRGEVGLEPLELTDIEDLETVSILGTEAPLLDVRGDYSGMGDGGGANYRVYGVALIRDTISVFVKMVGPEDEVASLREAFLQFVSSLEEA